MSPQLGEIRAVNDQLREQLECLGLSERRKIKRNEQLQRQVRTLLKIKINQQIDESIMFMVWCGWHFPIAYVTTI